MAKLLTTVVGTALLAQLAVPAAHAAIQRAMPAEGGSIEARQDATDATVDEESLDAGAPAAAQETASSETAAPVDDTETLDAGSRPTALPADAAPPPSQPAPAPAPQPAPAPAPVPAPAAAPAPAAEPAAAPVDTSVPTHATSWPFSGGGGVFVNAGFGPGEAGQSVGIDTCENRVVNGRAYVGVHCSGGNLVAGFTPPFWATAGTGPKYPSVSIGTAPATSPFPAGFPFNEPVAAAPAQPVQETTPNVSSGAPVAPTQGYRAVSGPSRTITNTIIRREDGVDQAVTAAGQDSALLQRNQNRIDRKNDNRNGNNNNDKKKDNKKQAADESSNADRQRQRGNGSGGGKDAKRQKQRVERRQELREKRQERRGDARSSVDRALEKRQRLSCKAWEQAAAQAVSAAMAIDAPASCDRAAGSRSAGR